jgi:hypothetical protein
MMIKELDRSSSADTGSEPALEISSTLTQDIGVEPLYKI